MGRGQRNPLVKRMSARGLILTLWPVKPARQLELNIEQCSYRQARRMVATGHVPKRLERDFWNVVEQAAEELLARVERVRTLARHQGEISRARRMAAESDSESDQETTR